MFMEINFVELQTDEMLQINGGYNRARARAEAKAKDTRKYPCYINGIYFSDANTPHFTPSFTIPEIFNAFASSL